MEWKKAEHQRIDAFELWCWRRLLRVPWTARRSNQSILREISPGCSLEGLMLKLKLQYFDHLLRRAGSFEKPPMLGKIEGRRRRGRRRMRWPNLCLVKAIVFPVVMYGYESHTIVKAEHRRSESFELWCWRRLLRVPWTVRRSDQSILREISPGCSLEGLMLKMKL